MRVLRPSVPSLHHRLERQFATTRCVVLIARRLLHKRRRARSCLLSVRAIISMSSSGRRARFALSPICCSFSGTARSWVRVRDCMSAAMSGILRGSPVVGLLAECAVVYNSSKCVAEYRESRLVRGNPLRRLCRQVAGTGRRNMHMLLAVTKQSVGSFHLL